MFCDLEPCSVIFIIFTFHDPILLLTYQYDPRVIINPGSTYPPAYVFCLPARNLPVLPPYLSTSSTYLPTSQFYLPTSSAYKRTTYLLFLHD